MKDANGNFVGVSSIGEDLTQRYKAQPVNNDANHAQDNKCALLANYETKATLGTEGALGDLVLVKVLKSLAADKGHVQLAVHKDTKQQVAVKSLRKDLMKPEELDRARREIEIMQQLTKLNNPYIIKLLGYEETPTHLNLLVEYLSGGELVTLILENKGLKEPHAQRLFKQLVCAINACHQSSVVHRDIKLQNIMLDEQGNVRLIDFGLSNFVEVGRFRNTFCGTPAYAPPEILLGTQYKGPEVDVWSLGVVLYSMLTAEFPFTTIAEILKGKFKEPTTCSSECLDLLKRMLTVKKEARITLPEVMNHPWVLKHLDGSNETGRGNCEADEPATKRQRRTSIAIEQPSS
jgi:serine/threonine protein kinase